MEEEKFKCCICLDCVEDEIITLKNCQHTFHLSCLKTWYIKSNSCPLCRESIKDLFIVSIDFGFLNKKKYLVDIVENKVNFYRLTKRKKKDTMPNNIIIEENYFLNLDKYIIHDLEESIIFNDISRIEALTVTGKIKFNKMGASLDKNKKLKIIRCNNTNDEKKTHLFLKLKNKGDTMVFFDIIVKRFNFFREINN